ncbi:hypothetical protein SRHO_G00090520 [Serrasalmus rhombeus]
MPGGPLDRESSRGGDGLLDIPKTLSSVTGKQRGCCSWTKGGGQCDVRAHRGTRDALCILSRASYPLKHLPEKRQNCSEWLKSSESASSRVKSAGSASPLDGGKSPQIGFPSSRLLSLTLSCGPVYLDFQN